MCDSSDYSLILYTFSDGLLHIWMILKISVIINTHSSLYLKRSGKWLAHKMYVLPEIQKECSEKNIYCLRREEKVIPNSDRDTKGSFIDRRDHYIWVLKHGKEFNSELKNNGWSTGQHSSHPQLPLPLFFYYLESTKLQLLTLKSRGYVHSYAFYFMFP